MTRFPIGLTVSAAIAFVLLLGLGRWQIERLHWKQGLLARIAALQHAPPQPIVAILGRAAAGADIDYTRVAADCPQVERSAYLRLYSLHDGAAGYRIITACVLAAGPYGSVLVDRGFVAQDAAGEASPPPGQVIAQPLVGILRGGDLKTFVTPDNQPAQRLFYSRDIPAMARVLGAVGPAPIFLMLESPAPKSGLPVPTPAPADIPNNHLEYAVTWFGLAGALACVYLASLWRRLRSK